MSNNSNTSASSTGWVYDPIYLEHEVSPGHPECPERLKAIVARLEKVGLAEQLVPIAAAPVDEKWLTTVHAPDYPPRVKSACQYNMRYMDSMDTPVGPRSYDAALVAVGGVLAATDAVLDGRVRNAFCAVRPPGHHACEFQAMGFCLFNNVAIAARYLQRQHQISKVLIVDFDVHHGNGTQEAFYSDPDVLFYSSHRYPFYPGTGAAGEIGDGPGRGLVINVPLAAGSDDAAHVSAMQEKLLPAAEQFQPEFVLVSAGFDSHRLDPLGGMRVTTEGFAQLTRIIKQIAEQYCQGRLVATLEGGYHLDALAESVEAHLRVLMEPRPGS